MEAVEWRSPKDMEITAPTFASAHSRKSGADIEPASCCGDSVSFHPNVACTAETRGCRCRRRFKE